MARARRALTEDEEETISSFVLASRRDRERLLLARGDDDRSAWAHGPPLDPEAMWQVPAAWSAGDLLVELRRHGAPEVAVGIQGQLAGQVVALADAVEVVFAPRYGDLISL